MLSGCLVFCDSVCVAPRCARVSDRLRPCTWSDRIAVSKSQRNFESRDTVNGHSTSGNGAGRVKSVETASRSGPTAGSETRAEPGLKFIQQFFQHVLPSGFQSRLGELGDSGYDSNSQLENKSC